MYRVWYCKIGGSNTPPGSEWIHPFQPYSGADVPMRKAVRDSYTNMIGEQPEFIFSGWGSELSIWEKAVQENRTPNEVELIEERKRLLRELEVVEEQLGFR